ncbi:MAG: B12-binding domain-containing radical SAM protein [Peptococcaceae bacterium]|jgi:radical SAM superfamily enzyme YgiQ (UPF0313 family)|nr:B12-binding domain-containing radical SAM protein [Peptococcaceae bacterium]
MKILFVYPEIPITYWGFQYALKFVSKKAGYPPLGLLTVAALFPEHYEKRLVDMNVSKLKDKDILWADYVLISAMAVQQESVRTVINRCHELGRKIIAGGPLFTSDYEEYDDVDYLVLNEGELTVPAFVRDLEKGVAQHIYTTQEWADLRSTPVPLWNLIDFKKYATMNIQYSRGCPFNCDFCNVTTLYGHVPRTKDTAQLLKELDSLYNAGWRGGIFLVDDNFIGNKKKLKQEVLPALTSWMQEKKYPFYFFTEASINLADDEELMQMMVKAGFNTVFIGIETTNEESLVECNKLQNKDRDLIKCVKKIHSFGLQVQGGFIVGFDHDNATVFEKMVHFIQESGIVTAMVGLLNAPKGTKLYRRLAKEGRLIDNFSGNNTDYSINFIPKMDKNLLVKGYQHIVETIYSPHRYYERVFKFLNEYKPAEFMAIKKLNFCHLKALVKSIIHLGLLGPERFYFWKLILWSLLKRPKLFPLAVTLCIYGFHFRKVFSQLHQ